MSFTDRKHFPYYVMGYHLNCIQTTTHTLVALLNTVKIRHIQMTQKRFNLVSKQFTYNLSSCNLQSTLPNLLARDISLHI